MNIELGEVCSFTPKCIQILPRYRTPRFLLQHLLWLLVGLGWVGWLVVATHIFWEFSHRTLLGEDEAILTSILFRWVVQPPTRVGLELGLLEVGSVRWAEVYQ